MPCMIANRGQGPTFLELATSVKWRHIYQALEGSQECRMLRLSDGVALHIGPGETLIGIEILDAKHVFGAEELPDLVVENVPLAVSG